MKQGNTRAENLRPVRRQARGEPTMHDLGACRVISHGGGAARAAYPGASERRSRSSWHLHLLEYAGDDSFLNGSPPARAAVLDDLLREQGAEDLQRFRVAVLHRDPFDDEVGALPEDHAGIERERPPAFRSEGDRASAHRRPREGMRAYLSTKM